MIVLYLMASATQCSRFLLRKQSAVFSRRMCNGLTLYESLVKSHCVTGTANAKPVARLSQSPVVANSSRFLMMGIICNTSSGLEMEENQSDDSLQNSSRLHQPKKWNAKPRQSIQIRLMTSTGTDYSARISWGSPETLLLTASGERWYRNDSLMEREWLRHQQHETWRERAEISQLSDDEEEDEKRLWDARRWCKLRTQSTPVSKWVDHSEKAPGAETVRWSVL